MAFLCFSKPLEAREIEALKQEKERADSFRLSVEELKRSCEQQVAKEESQAQALRAVEVGFD